MNTNKVHHTTATFDELNFLQHFGIHPITASLFGDKEEDIKNIEFKIDENQERVDRSNEKYTEPDYWAWWSIDEEQFTMIYSQYFLLDMCFPSGIVLSEKAGIGKAYRIKIVNVK